MKPFSWTLLALGAASCSATRNADSPALGPESRVVVPLLQEPAAQEPPLPRAPLGEEPAQPRAQLAADPAQPRAQLGEEPAQPAVVPAAEPAPNTARAVDLGWLEALARELTARSASAEESSSTLVAPTAPEVTPAPEPAPQTPSDPASYLRLKPALEAECAKALAEKRYDDVRKLAAQILALDPLEQARVLCRDEDWAQARTVLAKALAEWPERPEPPELLEASGLVVLHLADAGQRELYPEALDFLSRAGPKPKALLGASRALAAGGNFDKALESAQRALILLASQPGERLALDPAPEVVLADAGLGVYRRLRAEPSPQAPALFDEMEAALKSRIARVATDAVAHERLASLYLESGRVKDAVNAAWNGLMSSPGDERLTRLLADSARALGGADGEKGSEKLLEIFTNFRELFRLQPLGYWYPALEYFHSSAARVRLEDFKGLKPEKETQLERAERYFKQTRDLDLRRSEACKQYEALCRALQGWELFTAGRLEEARAKFKSMDRVLAGSVGLDPASVDAKCALLGSGASGLARIAAVFREHQSFVEAAAVHAELADLVPDDPRWAREAAEAAKVAAGALADEAGDLDRASRGEIQDGARLDALRMQAGVSQKNVGTPKEKDRLSAKARDKERRSNDMFVQSWSRYRDAVRLAPQNVQLACDAALVAIYHVPSEVAAAEALLDNARRVAAEQLASPTLEETERRQLMHALADALAHQGVIELDFKRDPAKAVALLEESVATDPSPRPGVRETLLPRAKIARSELPGGTAPAEAPGAKKDP